MGSSTRLVLTASILTLCACGGATASGLAVGKLGSGLGAHAQGAPQGAETCAVQKAIAAKPSIRGGAAGKECNDSLKSDRKWRAAMRVLAAYADTLEALASGNGDSAGEVHAARAGTPESDAAAKLVDVMRGEAAKEDLEKLIGAAAPHVKSICDGLGEYLDDQAQKAGQALADVEEKRGSLTDRRCGTLNKQSVCVNESLTDRVTYGHLYGQLALIESNHVAARDAAAAFCAAHRELESAAEDGKLDDEGTHAAIVKAVKSSHGPAPGAASAADDAAEKK